jgi:hypothetical protein
MAGLNNINFFAPYISKKIKKAGKIIAKSAFSV